jgi:hypothetical protein
MDRNETIKAIKANLQRRSNKTWSVVGGKGTAYSWITISAPPKRLDEYGYMTLADRQELSELLSKTNGDLVHRQGEMIPGANDYYQEYLDRSAGITPTSIGKPYWD